jgi:hypothetical protein
MFKSRCYCRSPLLTSKMCPWLRTWLSRHVASEKGNRYQLYELVRPTYLSYFLWKSGWGSAEHSLYCAAEGLLEASAEVGEKTDDWMLNAEAAALMEVILRTFDNQIATAQGGVYAKCRAKLDLLFRVDLPGRFEPDVLADHS